MKKPTTVPVDQLTQEPYASVLCFPKTSKAEVQSRIQELRTHGIKAFEFSGSASLFGVGVPVLGKGFVGIVVIAHLNGRRVAVKIRRSDADRADLLHEAQMLSVANSVNVGPRLVAASKNFLIMHLIDGILITDWLETNKDAATLKRVLGEVLEQCFRLDQAGLDHGELSKAPKHLIVDKAQKPFIVDFETASIERRVANVTAVCQYLFSGNSSASKIYVEVFGEKDRFKLIEALRRYKKNPSQEGFEALRQVCFS
jgi:putative serine/threonine protein kinase